MWMNIKISFVFAMIGWSLLTCLGCQNDERNPLVITLIVPDGFSGFFEIVPSPKLSLEVTPDNRVEVIIDGVTTKSRNTEAFSRWHKLEARYASGNQVPTSQIYALSANSERQYFLLGDESSKDFFYSLGLVKSIGSLRMQHEVFMKRKAKNENSGG